METNKAGLGPLASALYILTVLDQNIRKNYDLSQKTLEFAVPVAMQGLVKQALTAKDERVKNKAFNDILDRDGRFAKVSRIGLPTSEQGGVAEDKDNKAVLEMLQAMQQAEKSSTNTKPATENTPDSPYKVQ